MFPVAWVHKQALALPPHVATAWVLVVAAALALIVGLLRGGRPFTRRSAGVLYAGLASVLLLPDWVLARLPQGRWALLIAAGLSLLVHVLINREEPEGAEGESGAGDARGARVYLVVALVVAALLLFERLGSYYSVLVAWEATVTDGFANAFAAGEGVWDYTRKRFLWDDGILSAGHTSLFYGAPTYALMQLAGFSPLTLRLCSAVAALLSVAVIYAVGCRFFGRVAGAAAAVLFALSHTVLFYGRYGSSPAGTLLAALLALFCVWVFLDRDRSAWWMSVPAAVALFVATLQYAPARLVVVVLLAVTAVVSVARWRRLWWQRAFGLIVLGAAVAGFWRMEQHFQRTHLFVNARGETFLHFVRSPGVIKGLVGREVTSQDLRPGGLSLPDKAALLAGVLEITVPQYLEQLWPNVRRPGQGVALGLDPPPLSLYYVPAGIFVLWGFAYSLVRFTDFRHLCLLAWVFGTTGPLLLTNRVDSHRILMFVIPLTLWGAVGVREAVRAWRAARMPSLVGHAFAVAAIVTAVYSAVNVLYIDPRRVDPPPVGTGMLAEINSIKGPVVLGLDWDHREVGWIRLGMTERARREPGWSGTMLPEGVLRGVVNDGGEPIEFELRNLRRFIDNATVLVGPAERFKKGVAALQERGVRVSEREASRLRFYRLDSGAAATGVPDEELKPLPTIVIPPTPTPIPLRTGPQISLGDLKPTDVQFGFAPPQIDREFDNPPLKLGGVIYPRGIGMHAWCRMTYAVPARAVELQAIIGIADKMRECPQAAVTFEVRDESGALLYDSGLVDGATPPIPIHVDVRGKKAVTLAVTDAKNGIDCDHANWALAAFMLE
jgi:hypothetical protein